MFDDIMNLKSQMMFKIRKQIRNHLSFCNSKMKINIETFTTRKTWMIDFDRKYVRMSLIFVHCVIWLTLNTIQSKNQLRWMNDLIVKILIVLFFDRKKNAMRMIHNTKAYFDFINHEILWLICTMIHIALKNYETDAFKKIIFHDELIDDKLFFHDRS